MYTIHLVLLVASAGAVAASAVGGRWWRRTGQPHAQALALLVAGALVVGNAVSLAPTSPRWYSLAVVALSIAGLGWLAIALVAGGRNAAAGAAAGESRDRERYVPMYAVASPTDEPEDAVVVTGGPLEAAVPDNVVPLRRDRRADLATQETFAEAGPRGGRTTVGQGSHVGGHLEDYLPEPASSRRRAAGARRRRQTPEQAARRLRVLRAYGASEDLRGRIHTERA